MLIELCEHEFRFAAAVGLARQVSNYLANRVTNATDPWGTHVQGACAEYAFAKMTGIHWEPTVDTFTSIPDVGGVEVKSTKTENGALVLKEKDRADRPFVLIVVSRLKFRMVGWEFGHVVKEQGEHRSDGTYRLDQTMLQPVETIPFGGSTGRR